MIVRTKRSTNFTIISNTGMEDPRLSFKAKGILAYLLSKPDDWQVRDRQLATVGPDGRSAVQAALRELEAYGYIHRIRERNEQGQWVYTSYVYDEPWLRNPSTAEPRTEKPWTDNPATEKPATEKPAAENRAILNTVVTSTDQTNTEEPSTEEPAGSPAHDENRPDPETNDKKRTAALVDRLHTVGVAITPFMVEQYMELVAEVGTDAVLRGLTAAAENGKQHKFKYVTACARNIHAGVLPGNGQGRPYQNGGNPNGNRSSNTGTNTGQTQQSRPDPGWDLTVQLVNREITEDEYEQQLRARGLDPFLYGVGENAV